MKKVRLLIINTLVLSSIAVSGIAQNWKVSIEEYRDSVNQVFADPEQTILKDADLASFEGVPYYAIDASYRVNANFESVENASFFEMKTSTERLPEYRVYGRLTFILNGKQHSLEVYQNKQLMMNPVYKNHLFIPFTDETNYEGTYPGGRYLDLEIGDIDGNSVILDFNKCYNPYCAYNDKYSCPIPPSVNHLETRVEAGVRYDKH